jgi:hypothetical protein
MLNTIAQRFLLFLFFLLVSCEALEPLKNDDFEGVRFKGRRVVADQWSYGFSYECVIDVKERDSLHTIGFLVDTVKTAEGRSPVLGLETRPLQAGWIRTFISDLNGGHVYYIKPFVKRRGRTYFGAEDTFSLKPPSVPSLYITNISNVRSQGADVDFRVLNSGGSPVETVGIIWTLTPSFSLEQNEGKLEKPGGIGPQAFTLTGMQPSTTYYVWAYAKNKVGTGSVSVFVKTRSEFAAFEQPVLEEITSTSIRLRAVFDDAGIPQDSIGVFWGRGSDVTVANAEGWKKQSGTNSPVTISGLTGAQTYVMRFAAFKNGTPVYSPPVFATVPYALPTVTTLSVESVTATGFSLSGMITDDGGAPILDRGVAWNVGVVFTGGNGATHVPAPSSDSPFMVKVTPSPSDTVFSAAAYARNSSGTAYGEVRLINTKAPKIRSRD